MNTYSQYSIQVKEIAKQAGSIIMQYYCTDYDVIDKKDNSPLTQADIAANDFIVNALKEVEPDIAVAAEENDSTENTAAIKQQKFWLVDPLDGTKSFVAKTGQFTVNIGLIENGCPIGGVIYVPVSQTLYFTGADNKAYVQHENGEAINITARKIPKDGAVVVASKSHNTKETDDYIKNKIDKVKKLVSASSSLKFCLIAEGKADIYPRFGTTMQWDTAAGHAILNAAGGRVEQQDGCKFKYGKDKLENPFFIAFGKL